MAKQRIRKFSTTLNAFFAILLACSVAAAYILSLFSTYRVTMERSIADTSEIISQVSKNINNYLENAKSYTASLSENLSVTNFLNQTNEEDAEYYLSNFNSFVKRMSLTYKDVIAVAVVDANGAPVYLSPGLTFSEDYDISGEMWYTKVRNSRSKVEMSVLHNQQMIRELQGDSVIVFSKTMLNEHTNRTSGTMIVYQRYNVMPNTVRNIDLGKNGFIFILDKSGNMMYYPDKSDFSKDFSVSSKDLISDTAEYINQINRNNDIYLISQNTINTANVFGVVYPSDILNRVSSTLVVYAFITVILVVIMLILSYLLTKRFTYPLVDLAKEVESFDFQGTPLQLPHSSIKEIESLSASLDSMVGTIDQLLEENLQKQNDLHQKELEVLWTQINPHLLYNSMDAIVSTAENGDMQKVVDITMALSKYFRIALSQGDAMISVQDEILHVKNYLIIQKIRYNKLEFDIDVDEKILDCMVPKLFLQPIVENSIYHGIKYNTEKGIIRIRAYLDRDFIRFDIEDNGRGMKREELDDVFKKQSDEIISHGIGLRNIQDRLRGYYGMEAKIVIESKFKKGTIVSIWIPRSGSTETL